MFLSTGNAYVGNVLGCVKDVKDPFEAQEGRWDFPRDATAKKGLHLTLMGESPGFSRVAAGNMGFLLSLRGTSVFLSSGDGYVGDLLELQQGCEGPF